MVSLTIFTPTYNRSDKLERIYNSLLNQKCFDFEWLIIDDGSTDNTNQIVQEYKQNAPFSIRYYKQKNGGKHRAYNRALVEAQGRLFFCLDSDDFLSDNAVCDIIKSIGQSDEEHFIVAYKVDITGRRLSSTFPPIQECALQELDQEYNCRGEFSLIFPTDLAKAYPFPTFEGEKFLTEAVVYDRIALHFRAILLSKVITVCEYQESGLTRNLNILMKNNPAGFCLYYMQRIDLQENLFKRCISAGKYNAFRYFARENKSCYTGAHKALVSLTKPLGFLFRYYYIIARGF